MGSIRVEVEYCLPALRGDVVTAVGGWGEMTVALLSIMGEQSGSFLVVVASSTSHLRDDLSSKLDERVVGRGTID